MLHQRPHWAENLNLKTSHCSYYCLETEILFWSSLEGKINLVYWFIYYSRMTHVWASVSISIQRALFFVTVQTITGTSHEWFWYLDTYFLNVSASFSFTLMILLFHHLECILNWALDCHVYIDWYQSKCRLILHLLNTWIYLEAFSSLVRIQKNSQQSFGVKLNLRGCVKYSESLCGGIGFSP